MVLSCLVLSKVVCCYIYVVPSPPYMVLVYWYKECSLFFPLPPSLPRFVCRLVRDIVHPSIIIIFFLFFSCFLLSTPPSAPPRPCPIAHCTYPLSISPPSRLPTRLLPPVMRRLRHKRLLALARGGLALLGAVVLGHKAQLAPVLRHLFG